MKRKHQRLLASVMALVMTATLAPTASASRLNELKYAPDKGITDTINYVGQLDSLKRVLFVGAHPDDESNSLLVYLNRKEGADTIYTTINWGEGGDNSIGNELYGALGVLRSQELNSARMFDLAEQMYGGAVDFGYSVSLKESLLGDPDTNSDGIYSIDALGYNLAKIIRTTRPQVMFSNHKAPNTDHGQHRAVGWLIEYAIDLAAKDDYVIYGDDDSVLPAWQVQKFFSTTPSQNLINSYQGEFTAVGANSSVNPTTPDLVLDLGEYDDILGMSYNEWGVLGRNMHKCQKMIGTPSKGESESKYILKKAAPGATVSGDFSSTIFGGIDVVDVDDWDPQVKDPVYQTTADTAVQTIATNLNDFEDNFNTKNITANADKLTEALTRLNEVEALLDPDDADNQEYARRIREHITTVLKEIYAIDIDISVNDTDVVPGQTVTVTATAWARNDASDDVKLPDKVSDLLSLPSGWNISNEQTPVNVYSNNKDAGVRFVCDVTVPESYKEYTGPYNAPYDEPYTNDAYPNGGVKNGATPNTPALAGVADHQDPAKMTAAMVENQNAYDDIDFGVTVNSTDPYSHSPIRAALTAETDGVQYTIEGEPEMRVVPKLSLLVNNESSMLKYTGKDIKSTIEVTIRNNLKGATGDVTVTAAPEDASSGIEVSTKTVSMSSENQTVTVTLDVTVPAEYKDKGTGLVVTATLPNGEAFSEGYQIIDYDHINTQNYYKKAVQNVTVAEYQLPTDDIRIGFLKGGSDDFVYDYIRGMYSSTAKADENLKELSTADIAKSGAELAQQFDTIIIGKTALADQSPVSSALRNAMQNLLDYANAGGNLVLHYQNWNAEGTFYSGGTMPFAPVPFFLGVSNINKEDCDVYVSDAAAETPFYTGINKIDLEREGELSKSSIWDGWTQQRCEWTPGTAAAGQVEAMEALGYTVLFEGQDPEGEMRPAILYKEMDNGGHYTYSAVVWDRQLQALTPGAYKLYANLISMGTEGSGNVGQIEEPDEGDSGSGSGSGGGSSSGASSSGGGSAAAQQPSISTGNGGTATLSSDGKTLTIKPNDGYVVKDVTVNGVSKGAVTKVTGLKTGDKVVVTFASADTEGHKCAAFTDIQNHWGKDAICYVVENDLFNGVSETKFAPDNSMTRAMLVTVLYRMDGASYSASRVFSDVPTNIWYSEAVAWAAANGIVNGVSDTSFAPDKNITREQMAAILYRYAQFKKQDVSNSTSLSVFSDASAVSSYAQSAMSWAVAEELISGRTATTLVPQGTATRAEVATVLMRFEQQK